MNDSVSSNVVQFSAPFSSSPSSLDPNTTPQALTNPLSYPPPAPDPSNPYAAIVTAPHQVDPTRSLISLCSESVLVKNPFSQYLPVNNWSSVLLLLEQSAPPISPTELFALDPSNAETPLSWATRLHASKRIVELMLLRSSDPRGLCADSPHRHQLIDASIEDTVVGHYGQGPRGWLPLHGASAYGGDLGIVKLLIRHFPPALVTVSDGGTPHQIIYSGANFGMVDPDRIPFVELLTAETARYKKNPLSYERDMKRVGRKCGLEGCGIEATWDSRKALKDCNCGNISYCCEAHQKLDWDNHKSTTHR